MSRRSVAARRHVGATSPHAAGQPADHGRVFVASLCHGGMQAFPRDTDGGSCRGSCRGLPKTFCAGDECYLMWDGGPRGGGPRGGGPRSLALSFTAHPARSAPTYMVLGVASRSLRTCTEIYIYFLIQVRKSICIPSRSCLAGPGSRFRLPTPRGLRAGENAKPLPALTPPVPRCWDPAVTWAATWKAP